MDTNKLMEFFNVQLELKEEYHNHKENMANGGFLVQLSLFGAIVSEGLWPPEWVSKVTDLPELGTFLVYFMLWFLIHYYIRWQLINKRTAAMYYAGYEKAFLYFVTNKLNGSDKEISKEESHKASTWRDYLSKVLYVPKGFQKMDASAKGLPEFIAREVRLQFKEGYGGVTLEILMTYASMLLMVLVGTKIFTS